MNRLIVISILLSLMTAPVCGQKKKEKALNAKELLKQSKISVTSGGDCFGGKEHAIVLLKKDSLERDSLKKDSIAAAVKTPAKKDSVRIDSIKTDSVPTAKVMKKK